MKVEIDQSGKIEQTEKDTILCLSNDTWYAIRIPKRVKRQIQRIFRLNNQIHNFILYVFCAGLTILLKKVNPQRKVIIDEEYQGKNLVIIHILQEMFSKEAIKPVVEFKRIGKRSLADYYAREVGKKHLRATWNISGTELLKQIKKTEVGKRLESA